MGKMQKDLSFENTNLLIVVTRVYIREDLWMGQEYPSPCWQCLSQMPLCNSVPSQCSLCNLIINCCTERHRGDTEVHREKTNVTSETITSMLDCFRNYRTASAGLMIFLVYKPFLWFTYLSL